METDNSKLTTPSVKRLILMRHAKSGWGNPGLADHDRPLNERGFKSAEVLGDWLRENDLEPDQALVSSARRTQETFAGLQLKIDSTVMRELFHAPSDTLIDAISEASGEILLIVAHNPGIGDLAMRIARMIRENPDHPRFNDYPTGATFVVEWESGSWQDLDWSTGKIHSFITPRELTEFSD